MKIDFNVMFIGIYFIFNDYFLALNNYFSFMKRFVFVINNPFKSNDFIELSQGSLWLFDPSETANLCTLI